MSAEIVLFKDHQREVSGAPSTEASAKSFAPGEVVFITGYDWELGDTKIRAVVVRQTEDWVHVRVPDVGSYSAHVSVVHAAEMEAA